MEEVFIKVKEANKELNKAIREASRLGFFPEVEVVTGNNDFNYGFSEIVICLRRTV